MSGKGLVVAEKPSVARELAAFLGCGRAEGGYYEGGGWVVCALHGHVVDLVQPKGYSDLGWDRPWSQVALPIVPPEYRWAATDPDAVSLVGELMDRPDVDRVVHACDDDREGEGIFRRVLKVHPTDKPVLRLWQHSLTDAALERAFADLRPDSEYDGLGDAAEARAVFDWLIGMNCTRACTNAYHTMCHAGRVTTPTLALVVERTHRNRDFKSVPWWAAEADLGCGMTVSAARRDREAEAASDAEAVRKDGSLLVAQASYSDVARPQPTLFDLAGLQKEASRRHRMSAKRALDALQALYEAKLATYPRTDSRYVTKDDLPEVEALLATPGVMAVAGDAAAAAWDGQRHDVARVASDKDVSGHTALLPTQEMRPEALGGLGDDQRKVAQLICERLLMATAEPGQDRRLALAGTSGGVTLRATVTARTRDGWRAVRGVADNKDGTGDEEDAEREVGRVPEGVRAGDRLPVTKVRVREGKTRPPALYTSSTLLSAMEGASRLVEDRSIAGALRKRAGQEHSGGIGTPATRATTIEELVRRGYVDRDAKDRLSSTELGDRVCAMAPAELRKVDMSARLETTLSAVERGDVTVAQAVGEAEEATRRLVSDVQGHVDPDLVERPKVEVVGTCPWCGQPLRLSRDGSRVWCTSRRVRRAEDGTLVVDDEGCGLSFSREVMGHRLTDGELASLVRDGRVHVRGLRTKAGSASGTVAMNPKGEQWATRVEFDPRRGASRGSGGRRKGGR